jgi:hypothetical protein
VEGNDSDIILRTVPHFPRVTEENTKNISHGSQCRSRYLNSGPLNTKQESYTLESTCGYTE